MVEATTPGFERGRNLKKLGLHGGRYLGVVLCNDCRVPVANRLGEEEGRGFAQLMQQLPQERLNIAQAGGGGQAERAIELTLDFVKEREAFGQKILDFQNTKLQTRRVQDAKLWSARTFVDQCVLEAPVNGELDATTASMAKYWCTEKQCEVHR